MIRIIDSQMPKISSNYNTEGKGRAERAREKRIGVANNNRSKAGLRNCGIKT